MKGAQKNRSSEYFLRQARKSERKYDWICAAKAYSQALGTIPTGNWLRKGEIQERIGYFFHRAAFQAKNREESKKYMELSKTSYCEAAELFEGVDVSLKQPMTTSCRAKAAYSRFWLAENPSERMASLDECWKLGKKAVDAYERIGDKLGYGRVCCQLLMCLLDRRFLAQDWQELEKILEEAMDFGENAVEALSEAGDFIGLSQAYCKLSFFYYAAGQLGIYESVEAQNELFQKALACAERTLNISEKTEDAYLIGNSTWTLGVMIGAVKGDYKSSKRYLERAIELGRVTKDNLLKAISYTELAGLISMGAQTIGNPEERRNQFRKAIQYAEDAIAYHERVSYPYTWSYYYKLRSQTSLALLETNLEKKRMLLEEAVKAGKRHLNEVEGLGSPEVLTTILHSLSVVLQELSNLKPASREGKRLLKEAARHREACLDEHERWSSPNSHWNRGMLYSRSAMIKADLAKQESNRQKKKDLLTKAVLTMEKSLEHCRKDLKMRKSAMKYASVGKVQDEFGNILEHLYSLARGTEIAERAINALEEARKTWQLLNQHNRIAESHWHIAKLYGDLAEHHSAMKEFELASKEYTQAAKSIPQLKGFYSEHSLYMNAWGEIEKSRLAHKDERYAHSAKHYQKCSQYLNGSRKWAYLASYFSAWALLERGEDLSKKNKPQDAIEIFNEAISGFGESAKTLDQKAEKLESSEERDEALKLTALAKLRRDYCLGRAFMEEAKILYEKGKKQLSAEKYSSAGRTFRKSMASLKNSETKEELLFATLLCQAWEKNAHADKRVDANLYDKAADLFAKAKDASLKRGGRLIAMANSFFCRAQALWIRSSTTLNMDLYGKSKEQLENAANYYQKAGLKKAAYWVEATKRLLDAHTYSKKAEAEALPDRRIGLYRLAEKCLRLSGDLYKKSGNLARQSEILQSLDRLKAERRLAMSLHEILMPPPSVSRTAGISASNSTEKAAGLNGFQSAAIRAHLSVPKNYTIGREIKLRLDLINVGKKDALIIRVEGLVPSGAKTVVRPSIFDFEDGSLNMKGKSIEPLAVESVHVEAQVTDMTTIRLTPKVIYVDELSNIRTHQMKTVVISPIVEFKSEPAQKIFNYLLKEFLLDNRKLVSIEESGWRSLPNLIKHAKVPKSSLYGSGGSLGPALSELEGKGLVDLTVFSKRRGRGGHILMARVCFRSELVKRLIESQGIKITT